MLVKTLCFKRRYVKTSSRMVNKAAWLCGLILVLLIVICYLLTSVDLGELQKNLQSWTKAKISLLHGAASNDKGVINKDVLAKNKEGNPPLQNKDQNSKEINKKLEPLQYYNDTIEQLNGIRIFDWSVPVRSNSTCIPIKNLHKTTYICLFDPKEDISLSRKLKKTGLWDPLLLHEFRLLLGRRQDLDFVDIGSNLGVYSLTAATLGHDVVCVEPFGRVLPNFHKSVVKNKFQNRITLLANAISSKKEYVDITYTSHDMASAVVSSAKEEEITAKNIASGKIVSAITWKDLADFIHFKKIILKFDISLTNDQNNLLTEAKDLFAKLDVQYVFMHWGPSLLDAGNIVAFFTSRSYVPKKQVFGKPIKLKKFPKWKGGIIWEKANVK